MVDERVAATIAEIRVLLRGLTPELEQEALTRMVLAGAEPDRGRALNRVLLSVMVSLEMARDSEWQDRFGRSGDPLDVAAAVPLQDLVRELRDARAT